MLKIDKSQKAKLYFLLFICLLGVLIMFKNELELLFIPGPVKEMTYRHSFDEVPISYAKNIVKLKGFIIENQGLQLSPGSSGSIIFSFDKEPHQGCLLRVWFYGDEGEQQPNAIKISTDEGRLFQKVTGSGNYIGTLFDLSSYVRGANNFQLLFEAANYAPYITRIFGSIEVVLSGEEQARPALPNLPKILGLLLLMFMIFYFVMKDTIVRAERVTVVLLMFIILLAAYLRWNELVGIAGSILNPDVRGYHYFATKMDLFSDNGFYSAQFDKREPLYIFIIRMFFLFFGICDTHLRFVSFAFSIIMIYLTYRIGKEWFNDIVGLSAAFILSVHPYLISISASGFRSEWFVTLLLLFIYCGYVKTDMTSRWRVLITGFLMGCILLTRSECLPMLVITLVLYPLLAKEKWNYRMVMITLIVGISLLMPQLYSIYKKHGTPFYTVNQYARFYANREFMGNADFPSREEIAEEGMYTGVKITPIEYYFKMHTPWQFIKYNVVGFTKIYLRMPLSFVSGRGNLRKVIFRIDRLKNDFSISEIRKLLKLSGTILREKMWANLMGGIIFITFLAGLLLIGGGRHWMLYVYMIIFQLNTAFIAYLGLSERLSVHTYPFVAICCGFTFYKAYQRFLGKSTFYLRKYRTP